MERLQELQHACRLCLETPTTTPIQSPCREGVSFLFLAESLTKPLGACDMFSTQICRTCCLHLSILDNFRTKVEETERFLQSLLEESNESKQEIKSSVRSYKCPEKNCTKHFPTPSKLKRHSNVHKSRDEREVERRKMPKELNFLCSECGQKFPIKSRLKTHMIHHQNERKFGCPKCPKRFNRVSHLNVHLNVHNEVKQFKCQTCQQFFSNKGSLTRHQQILHEVNPPDFSCALCSRRFKLRYDLKRHLKRHTGELIYRCQVPGCRKTYTSHSGLKKHSLVRHSSK